jgi:hypothetical protein
MALTKIKTGGIADNAITNAKMADDAIDSADFADGSIDNVHLAGSIAVSKTLLSAGAGLTLSTNSLSVDADQSGQITQVGTLTALTGGTGDFNWDSNTLVVDSSASKVGIGTASMATVSGATDLTIGNTTGAHGMTLISNNGSTSSIFFGEAAGTVTGKIEYDNSIQDMFFTCEGSKRMTINSTGVGIGTDSPAKLLHIKSQYGTTFDASDPNDYGPTIQIDNVSNTPNTAATLLFTHRDNSVGYAGISSLSDGGDKANLLFFTRNNSPNTITERMRIDYDGVVSTSGDFKPGADVIMANGRGIGFAASGTDGTTMSSELLDDYEEGTWTCTITCTGDGFTTSGRNTTGTYTKVGRVVTVFADASINTPASGSGNCIITGLPFTSDGTQTYTTSAILFGRFDLPGSDGYVGRVYDSTTVELFYLQDASNASPLLASHINDNATPYISFSLTYET